MNCRQELSTLLKNKYNKKVYIEIFNILSDEKYSTNSNGIFFNLKDIEDCKIQKCIDYINFLSYNIEDHIKNLSLREEIEQEYKSSLAIPKNNKVYVKEDKKKIIREPLEPVPLVSPFGKKTYKSKVFKRLDNIMLGKKKEEKNEKKERKVKKVKKDNKPEPQLEEIESEEIEEDLFGDGDDEETYDDSIKVSDDDQDYESE